MKPSFLAMIVALFATACAPTEPVVQTPPETAATASNASEQWLNHPNRITSPEIYNATFVGKTIKNGSSSFLLGADGTITGSGNNSADEPFTFSGNYEFRDGMYCRWNGLVNGEPMTDDCQVVILENGKNLTVVRNSGRGKAIEYELVI